MTAVDETLTRKIADLARLELTDEEARTYARQLGEVLAYVEQLQEVDVSGVEPMIHPHDAELPLRDDVVRPSPVDAQGKPRVLSCAPEVVDDGYKVPPVL